MEHRFIRTELLIGAVGLNKLAQARVAVFGVGGVGSYVVEALVRAGVGSLVLVDHDQVSVSNINRQLPALDTTVGQAKVSLLAERARLINPKVEVLALQEFYTPEKGDYLLTKELSYVVDAIDNVTGKLDLIKRCKERGIPIISSMGAGNKLDPAAFKVADIGQTSVDPLAKVIRRELRKSGITAGVKVVFSTEPPVTPKIMADPVRRQVPGSISFVPGAAGLIMAGAVVRDLINWPGVN